MNTIISNEEYREYLRKESAKMQIIVSIIMFVFAAVMMTMWFSFTYPRIIDLENDDSVIFLVITTVSLLMGVIFLFTYRRVVNSPYESPIYNNYIDYQASDMKVPLYRIINYGRHSEIVQVLVDLNKSNILAFDIRRKKLNRYIEAKTVETVFKFFYKTKNGMDSIKKSIQVIANGKKHRLYGSLNVVEKLHEYLKNESYHIEDNFPKQRSL